MNNSDSNAPNFHSLNYDTVETTNTRFSSLCDDFYRRRWMWIRVCSIVTSLILIGISISTVLIMRNTNTANRSITTTTTAASVTTSPPGTTRSTTTPKVNGESKWIVTGKTVAGGNGDGHQPNQLKRPMGICIDDDAQTIYIADSMNHRIVGYTYGASSGRVIAGGNGEGNGMRQLSYPTHVVVDKINNALIICDFANKRVVRWSRLYGTSQGTTILHIHCNGLTMDNNADLYVTVYDKHEVRRYTQGDEDGTIVAGGNGEGDQSNQLHNPSNIFVDEDHAVYISDTGNHRVMKWVKGAKEGVLVAGGQRRGHDLSQLSSPTGVIVDYFGNVYVSEYDNMRVTRWTPGAKEGRLIVGGSGRGNSSYRFDCPRDLSFDRKDNLYVLDMTNDRVQKFDIIEK